MDHNSHHFGKPDPHHIQNSVTVEAQNRAVEAH
jgi:hypothetical protein